jgi:hypothetical protein
MPRINSIFLPITHSSGHSAIIAVEKEVRGVGKDYVKAIATSITVAGHGITFAVSAVGLCESLIQHPGTDVGSFIDEMRKIARSAHNDAKDTYNKFSAVRRALLQACICDTISI